MTRRIVGFTVAVGFALGPAILVEAQESLGNAFADKAAAELKARNDTMEVTCSIKGEFVVCSGARVGDCLATGWLVNHDGSECRKKLE